MQLVNDTYSITSGIAYGSNASLAQTSKAPMGTVQATQRSYLLEGQAENNRTVTTWTRGQSGSFGVGPSWNACDDGSCLGYVQYNSGCDPASCCPPGDGYAACVQK